MNPAPPCSGMAPTGTSCPAPWGLIYNTKDTNDCLESKHCFDPQPQNGGDNAAWGKAMAYALLDITEFHQRKFALIHFFDKDGQTFSVPVGTRRGMCFPLFPPS